MADGVTEFPVVLISFVAGAAIFVLIFISKLVRSVVKVADGVDEQSKDLLSNSSKKPQQQSQSSKNVKKKQHVEKRLRPGKQSFSHPWLVTSLKGHSSTILDMDFSANGKFLATCGEDRAVFIWNTKDWHLKEHKNARLNIEYDHASLIRWSPDCKAFIVKRASENVVEAYKVNKRADGWIAGITKAFTYPKFHDDEIVSIGISPNGKFLMSCSNRTDVVIFDVKGTLLTHLDTCLMTNFSANISPCGRFLTASGFSPDAKVWEVQFNKAGEFQQVTRAFELQGHNSGIHQVAFSNDTSRAGTISKDGTWRVHNVKVEFEKGEDPHLIMSTKYKQNGAVSKVALSPSGDVVAVASGSDLSLYLTDTAELDITISDIYSEPITAVLFDAEGKYILTAGEKHVRVFHNGTGYKAAANLARAKLSQGNCTAAMRERLQNQAVDAEAFMTSLAVQ